MIDRIRSFWALINEKPLSEQRYEASSSDMFRLVGRFLLRKHIASVILIVTVGATAGNVSRFFYAWAGRFIADDIVEVHLLAADTAGENYINPAMPNENRRFATPSPHRSIRSLDQRHESSVGKPIGEKMSLIGILAGLLLAVLAADHVFTWIIRERMISIGQKLQFELRRSVYDKLQALSMNYHDQHSIGRQMTNLFSDVSNGRALMLQLLHAIPTNILTMAVGLAIMFSIDVPMSCMVILALPTYLVCYRWFHNRLGTVHQNLRERQGKLNAHITNRVSNFYLVKSFVKEAFEGLDYLRRGRLIVRDSLASAVLSTLFTIVCSVISGLMMVAVLWIGTLKVRDGNMSLGTLLLFYASAGYMFSPVASLSNLIGQFHQLRAISHKIMRVLDEPIAISDPQNPAAILQAAPEIRFDNVTLSYTEDRSPAICNLSFTLPAGKKLCVMGPSGSGKTTLARLAGRIYDPSEGSILLDDIDIRDFRITDMRKLIGFVSQEPVIFDGTIAENIRYGSEESSPERIITAAQGAQIHDFIVKLPSQYETLTCERGLTLSGGQKQRVNLARTLLYDPKMLVLDDCTSALDAQTEADLVKGFGAILKNRTAIMISHRISIALSCDFVLVLEEGRAAEFGPPRELLKTGGPFAKLYEEQTTAADVLQMKT